MKSRYLSKEGNILRLELIVNKEVFTRSLHCQIHCLFVCSRQEVKRIESQVGIEGSLVQRNLLELAAISALSVVVGCH